jgi:hypothetical protein
VKFKQAAKLCFFVGQKEFLLMMYGGIVLFAKLKMPKVKPKADFKMRYTSDSYFHCNVTVIVTREFSCHILATTPQLSKTKK